MDRPVEIREVSPFTLYRAVDVTMYDLIYGEKKVCVRSEILSETQRHGAETARDPAFELSRIIYLSGVPKDVQRLFVWLHR